MRDQQKQTEKTDPAAREELERHDLEDLEADPAEAAKVRGGSIDPICVPIKGKSSPTG